MGETVSENMMEILMMEGKNLGLSDDFIQGVRVAYDICKEEGYINLTDWDAMTDREQLDVVKNYCPDVSPASNNTDTSASFFVDWSFFTNATFKNLKKEHLAEIHSSTMAYYDNKRYRIDIGWETIAANSRRIFFVDVYESDAFWNHGCPIANIKSIVDPKSYENFQKRVEKVVKESIIEYGNGAA